MRLSDNKLNNITKASDYQDYWYITKQNLAFDELCYIASILEAWNDDTTISYQNFFDEHKTENRFGNLSPKVAHRATRNCERIGLLHSSSNYSATFLTPVYYTIKSLCKGNFRDTSKYQTIIDSQLEKIIQNTDKGFLIHPIMFILKILLIIGDITGDYRVSISEFKLFIATAKKWNEYFEVVESILRYRDDNAYKAQCDANASKFSDCRFNVLADNHSLLINDSRDIHIVDGGVPKVRRKVAEYELNELNIDNLETFKKLLYSRTSSVTQTIYYGCPGTGKSHRVKELTSGLNDELIIKYEDDPELPSNVYRTTFHPDYDYSTFVGCYKPVKENDKLDYKFVPQVFAKAYATAYLHPENDTYLIIEEINRGNCAQIFGDLFQLLDRNERGESVYPIVPDSELAKYLRSKDVPSDTLKLPSNLHIYATMNTSDQSLFPMDSAFKRRWAMEYVPIDYEEKKANFIITLSDGSTKPWLEFLRLVNAKINAATDSEDKQMGEFFIRDNMNSEEFKNKVMFYLWSEVCKDLYSAKGSGLKYFFRIRKQTPDPTTGITPSDQFTFADLFTSRNENDALIKGFFQRLEDDEKEEKAKQALNGQTA